MFGRDASLQSLSARLAIVERECEQLVGVVRTLLKMQAESASREARTQRTVAVLSSQVSELYSRLVEIEDAPVLTDQIDAGEAISEAAKG